MELISALSLQMPWMTIEEFKVLSSEGVNTANISAQSRQFLRESGKQAVASAKSLMLTCESLNIQILYPGHSLYSDGFYELEDPPIFLSLEGNWPPLKSMAIVGSREPSRFAVDWLNENLPIVLSKSECVVVSGGARGIDLTAHLTAARSGHPTLVYLPSGLNNFYPRDLRRYKDLIIEGGGGFISEFAPNTEMRKFHFIKRNRLIVASSDVVFVVEARRKSGSMLTAGIAGSMNKTVCTLPSAPSMSCSQGSLDLIFGGAFPIRDQLDLVALLSISSRRA